MVSYYNAGHLVGGGAGQPQRASRPTTPAASKVAVQKDTVQVADITARSKAVHGRRQAGDHHRAVPAAERRHQRGRHRQGRRPCSPTPRSSPTRSSRPAASSSSSATIYDAAPYGDRGPQGPGRLRQGDPGRRPEADRQRGLHADPQAAGASSAGAVTTSEVNPTASERAPSRQPREHRERPDPIKAIPVRHPGRWVAIVVILVLVAMFVNSVVTNPNWQWQLPAGERVHPPVLRGVWTTLWLTVVSMVIGVCSAIVLAVMRLSPNPVLSGSAWVVRLGLPRHPGAGPAGDLGEPRLAVPEDLARRPVRPGVVHRSTPATSSRTSRRRCSGLGLNEAAYMAEIVRAGILSVDEGQSEAAAGARDVPDADHAADRPAAGHARHRAADRQRDDLDAQDTSLVSAVPYARAVLPDDVDRQPHLPGRSRCSSRRASGTWR